MSNETRCGPECRHYDISMFSVPICWGKGGTEVITNSVDPRCPLNDPVLPSLVVPRQLKWVSLLRINYHPEDLEC